MPCERFETRLDRHRRLTTAGPQTSGQRPRAEVDEAIEFARVQSRIPAPESALADVFA